MLNDVFRGIIDQPFVHANPALFKQYHVPGAVRLLEEAKGKNKKWPTTPEKSGF